MKAGRVGGGATKCMSYGMSGATVCIIHAKVCTCFARLRNALCETTEGPEVSPEGGEPGVVEQALVVIRHLCLNVCVPIGPTFVSGGRLPSESVGVVGHRWFFGEVSLHVGRETFLQHRPSF